MYILDWKMNTTGSMFWQRW